MIFERIMRAQARAGKLSRREITKYALRRGRGDDRFLRWRLCTYSRMNGKYTSVGFSLAYYKFFPPQPTESQREIGLRRVRIYLIER